MTTTQNFIRFALLKKTKKRTLGYGYIYSTVYVDCRHYHKFKSYSNNEHWYTKSVKINGDLPFWIWNATSTSICVGIWVIQYILLFWFVYNRCIILRLFYCILFECSTNIFWPLVLRRFWCFNPIWYSTKGSATCFNKKVHKSNR